MQAGRHSQTVQAAGVGGTERGQGAKGLGVEADQDGGDVLVGFGFSVRAVGTGFPWRKGGWIEVKGWPSLLRPPFVCVLCGYVVTSKVALEMLSFFHSKLPNWQWHRGICRWAILFK